MSRHLSKKQRNKFLHLYRKHGRIDAEGIAVPKGPTQRRNGMKHIDIYTDGACRGNPGRGGWGAILVYGSVEKELSGGEKETTNNRMELTAVISALRALR